VVSRSVVRHPRFIEQLAELSRTHPRLVDVVDGALWELARKPDLGIADLTIGVYFARVFGPGTPSVVLYYSVNPRYLYALLIRAASSDET
jgi:hypothetical protein